MRYYQQTIEKGYNTYLKKYPDEKSVGVLDYDYPLQGSVLEPNMDNNRFKIESPLSKSCLVEYRSSVPPVHDLPMEDLAWMPVGLMRILKVQQSVDHEAVWTESAKILLQMNQNGDPFDESLVRNVETMVHAVLSSRTNLGFRGREKWSDEGNIESVIREAPILARYMAFPTLEGMVKCLIRKDIEMDGEVRPGRRIQSYNGDEYTEGKTVNDIGHLLWHLEQEWSEEPLSSSLKEAREAIEDFFKLQPETGLGYLSKQRNSALHGQVRARAESGVLLNLISLLILNIDHIPIEARQPS